jgi:hypothetical protein
MGNEKIGPGESAWSVRTGGGEAAGDEDVEGHGWKAARLSDDDTEGHAAGKAARLSDELSDDDTEGHAAGKAARLSDELSDDDTEGHRMAPRAGDDDDTEGHVRRAR